MRAICSLLWPPAAGNSAGLPAIHQVASSVIVSRAPAMSFALKRAKNSDASFLFSSMLIYESPDSGLAGVRLNLPESIQGWLDLQRLTVCYIFHCSLLTPVVL